MDCRKKSRLNAVCRAFAVAGMTLMLSAAGTGSASAQPATACDPEYMDALEARAWLEAQREISQNQNLIVKPDSVLEYTCFPLFLNELANNAASMFSETTHWGNIPEQGPGSMQVALQELMGTGMGSYNALNFPHTYLGGRASTDYQGGGGGGGGSGVSNRWSVSGASYTCGEMARVWNEAKCLNFFDEEDLDGFYDFAHYQNNDPRQLPDELAQCSPPSSGTFNFDNMMQIAFNQRQDTYVLQQENPNDTTPYEVDTLVTFLDFILPRGVAPADQCAPAIQTGITVDRRLSGSYPDAVCPNPGCYYDQSTCQ